MFAGAVSQVIEWGDSIRAIISPLLSPVMFSCLIKCNSMKQTVFLCSSEGESLWRRSWTLIGAAGWSSALTTKTDQIKKPSYFIRTCTDVTLPFTLSKTRTTALLITMCVLPYCVAVWREAFLSPSHSQLVAFKDADRRSSQCSCFYLCFPSGLLRRQENIIAQIQKINENEMTV